MQPFSRLEQPTVRFGRYPTSLAAFALALCLTGMDAAKGGATEIFRQEESGAIRPLTPEERTGLNDPFFTLVLARRPDAKRLDDIEALIQPDESKRRSFVVHEEIKDSAQPGIRRLIVDFLGSNGGVPVAGNVMLNVFMRSSGLPESIDIEAWGWDAESGIYNFYRLDGSGVRERERAWRLVSTSRDADLVDPQRRSGTCLACHVNGAPLMKELFFPWNNWHSFASTADYLTGDGRDDERWAIADDPHMERLVSAEHLETVVIGSIMRFNGHRFSELVKRDDSGALVVDDARRLLRPLFETTEINLASANQRSGLHPLSDRGLPGPAAAIHIPNSFFLNANLLAGGQGLKGLGIGEAKKFSEIATVEPGEYRDLVLEHRLAIDTTRLGVVPGDTEFAWFTPEPSFIDMHWIDLLIEKGAVSPAFAAAVLAIDLETPILSARRGSLLAFVPASYRSLPGEQHPDALTRAVITRLEAFGPAEGSAAAEYLALLRSNDPVAELRRLVTEYRNQTSGRMEASRKQELQRLLQRLIERRRAVLHHPVFRHQIESGALFPLP